MNLLQLRVLDTVVRESSFTRAAERLCTSQPAVTGYVKTPEEHYQVTLFRRTVRHIELTGEGSRLVAITRTLSVLKEEAGALLDVNRQLVSGRLEVVVDDPYLVMPMSARLRVSYPGIIVNLRLGNAQEAPAALLSECVDVVVLTGVETHPGPFLEELANSCICALLPRQHPWCERSEGIPLEELDQQITVPREPGSITRRILDCICASQGMQPRVLLELNSRGAVTEAVAAKLGIGVMFSPEVGNDPRVCAMPLVGPELTNCHLTGCPEKRRGLRTIRAFLELAAA